MSTFTRQSTTVLDSNIMTAKCFYALIVDMHPNVRNDSLVHTFTHLRIYTIYEINDEKHID